MSKTWMWVMTGVAAAAISLGPVSVPGAEDAKGKKEPAKAKAADTAGKKADAPMVFADPSKDPTKPAPGGVRWYWPTHGRCLERTKQGNIELCFLGDSITQGWPGDLFNKYYGKNAANFGCGGDKIQHLLLRLTDGELKGNSPKVIVLLIGICNMGSNTSEEIAYGIDHMVKYLRKTYPDSKVLLLGLLPNKGKEGDKIKATNKIIAKLDDGKTVRFLDMGPKFLDKDGKIPDGLLRDEVHLTPKGYEIWAETMKPLLAEMMGKPSP